METEETAKKELLLTYFSRNGLLLCNESQELPYLEMVGGDWNSIVALIEEGQVFYSKLYKSRVTYLSGELYACVKSYKQRLDKVSDTARSIYDFLAAAGRANTEEIKSVLMLSSKAYTRGMDKLLRELLVTAVARDRTIAANWSSFYWGTCKTWEAMHPAADIKDSDNRLRELTKNLLTEKKLNSLLR